MRLASKRINFRDKLTLVPFGDIHYGASACDEKHADRVLRYILDTPDCYGFCMGDVCDLVLPSDTKRYRGTVLKYECRQDTSKTYNYQRDLAIEKLKPLAESGKLLGILRGNHDEVAMHIHSYDIIKDITDVLKVPDLGYSCFFTMLVSKGGIGSIKKIDIFAHHGVGGGRKSGSSINRLEDLPAQWEADIYLMGHDHKRLGNKIDKLSVNKAGKLVKKQYIVARTGSFLKGYIEDDTTYVEYKLLNPATLGAIKIEIDVTGGSTGHQVDMTLTI